MTDENNTNEAKASETVQKGTFPHVFTAEEAKKGGINSGKTRRERALSFSERVRAFMEEHEEELLKSALSAAFEDWRAHMALLDRAYGTPAKAEPERVELDIGGSEARGVTLQEIIGSVSQAPVNAALNGETPREGLDQAKG